MPEFTPEGVEIPVGYRKGDRRLPFGTKKTVDVGGGELELRVGYCPCSECDHTYMWECDPDNQVLPDGSKGGCQCCRGTCT